MRGVYADDDSLDLSLESWVGTRLYCLRFVWGEVMTFLTLIMSVAFASESWFCTTESSRVMPDSVQACGAGIGREEGQARARALENAKIEFDSLCHISDNCIDRAVSVAPGRTTCEQGNGFTKCYRMVIFNLGDKSRRKEVARTVRATGENGDYTYDDFWRDWKNKYLRPN